MTDTGRTNPSIRYAIEPALDAGEFIDVLKRSTLAQRRPVDDADAIAGMLANAAVIVTARLADGLLIGVSRSLSDFSHCTYLADLAVDQAHQKRGIGRELVRRTHEAAGIHTTLILLAAPDAHAYYGRIGMTPHERCWVSPAGTPAGATVAPTPTRTHEHP